MTHDFSEEDEGKEVVDAKGDQIGLVSSVEGGAAYVNPDPDLTDSIKSKLGWAGVDQEDYKLEGDEVETVTDDEIRLGS